jgi:hypothetical protein
MAMKTLLSRRAIAPLTCGLLIAGCATPEQNASLECGAGGVAVGYVACKLMGNSDASCARFAVVAGGIGAAACYSYASNLEKRRQQLAGHENDLNARLQYVRGLNEDGQKLNSELQTRVAAATRRTGELQAQISQNRASGDQLAKERQRLDDELKNANQQVALQREALSEVKTYRSQRKQPSQDLDAEIAKQDRLLADAQRQVDTLASLRERV